MTQPNDHEWTCFRSFDARYMPPPPPTPSSSTIAPDAPFSPTTTPKRPLYALTTFLPELYQSINPKFAYTTNSNPRRVLTKPAKPVHNDGHDNEEWDYICYVGDVLGEREGGQYQILDMLGQGTFGQVVKCTNLKTKEAVAVKIIKNKPAYYNQSLVEVAILDMLNNQYDRDDKHHICRMKDTFVFRNHLCIAFEMLSVNLYELIKQNQFRGLSTNLVRVFVSQILDSLCVLNRAKIIHCDLKPENILLKNLESPTIKVIDFGSACHENQTVYTYIQSRFYRSPEVLLGLPYTSSIDMWSLGCIAAELFLGLPLFPGSSEYNQVSRIVEMLGTPPTYTIEKGKAASQFFHKQPGPDGRVIYKLKTMEEYMKEQNTTEQPSKRYFQGTTLSEIINAYPITRKSLSPREVDKEMHNRQAFIDFLRGLLNLNPLERWSPQQAKMHPFMTGEKWTGPFNPNSPKLLMSMMTSVHAANNTSPVTKRKSAGAHSTSESQQHAPPPVGMVTAATQSMIPSPSSATATATSALTAAMQAAKTATATTPTTPTTPISEQPTDGGGDSSPDEYVPPRRMRPRANTISSTSQVAPVPPQLQRLVGAMVGRQGNSNANNNASGGSSPTQQQYPNPSASSRRNSQLRHVISEMSPSQQPPQQSQQQTHPPLNLAEYSMNSTLRQPVAPGSSTSSLSSTGMSRNGSSSSSTGSLFAGAQQSASSSEEQQDVMMGGGVSSGTPGKDDVGIRQMTGNLAGIHIATQGRNVAGNYPQQQHLHLPQQNSPLLQNVSEPNSPYGTPPYPLRKSRSTSVTYGNPMADPTSAYIAMGMFNRMYNQPHGNGGAPASPNMGESPSSPYLPHPNPHHHQLQPQLMDAHPRHGEIGERSRLPSRVPSMATSLEFDPLEELERGGMGYLGNGSSSSLASSTRRDSRHGSRDNLNTATGNEESLPRSYSGDNQSWSTQADSQPFSPFQPPPLPPYHPHLHHHHHGVAPGVPGAPATSIGGANFSGVPMMAFTSRRASAPNIQPMGMNRQGSSSSISPSGSSSSNTNANANANGYGYPGANNGHGGYGMENPSSFASQLPMLHLQLQHYYQLQIKQQQQQQQQGNSSSESKRKGSGQQHDTEEGVFMASTDDLTMNTGVIPKLELTEPSPVSKDQDGFAIPSSVPQQSQQSQQQQQQQQQYFQQLQQFSQTPYTPPTAAYGDLDYMAQAMMFQRRHSAASSQQQQQQQYHYPAHPQQQQQLQYNQQQQAAYRRNSMPYTIPGSQQQHSPQMGNSPRSHANYLSTHPHHYYNNNRRQSSPSTSLSSSPSSMGGQMGGSGRRGTLPPQPNAQNRGNGNGNPDPNNNTESSS